MWRSALWGALLAMAAAAGHAAPVTLTAGQMRQAAVLSNQTGNFAQARDLALALIARDPKDTVALVTLVDAYSGLGDHARAAATAARAYRSAQDNDGRYLAARLAAREQIFLDHGTRAQIWLRRARQMSPNPQEAASVARDYAFIRARNPLSVTLNFGLAPSSNVNNGTWNTTQEVVIFGVPLDLPLSGDAQALSGLSVSAAGRLRYRVAQTDTSLTDVSVDLSGETYILSDAARALSPSSKGSDFSYASAAVGLEQLRAIADGKGSLSYGLDLGEVWSGGQPYYHFARVSLDRAMTLPGGDVLTTGISAERQLGDGIGDPRNLTLAHVDWSHQRQNGDRIDLTLTGIRAISFNDNYDYTGASLGVSYSLADAVAGGHLALGGEIGTRHYGISPLTLKPRDDTSFSLRATYRLDQIEYYGFSPEVTVSARQTDSNVSRYQTRDVGLELTLVSAF